MARTSSSDGKDASGEYQSFYDEHGQEFRAYTAVDVANARFAWGLSEEKPKKAEPLPEGPVGDPGPTSGAVSS